MNMTMKHLHYEGVFYFRKVIKNKYSKIYNGYNSESNEITEVSFES